MAIINYLQFVQTFPYKITENYKECRFFDIVYSYIWNMSQARKSDSLTCYAEVPCSVTLLTQTGSRYWTTSQRVAHNSTLPLLHSMNHRVSTIKILTPYVSQKFTFSLKLSTSPRSRSSPSLFPFTTPPNSKSTNLLPSLDSPLPQTKSVVSRLNTTRSSRDQRALGGSWKDSSRFVPPPTLSSQNYTQPPRWSSSSRSPRWMHALGCSRLYLRNVPRGWAEKLFG